MSPQEAAKDIYMHTPEQYLLAIDQLVVELLELMRQRPQVAAMDWMELRDKCWFTWPKVTYAQGETAMREAKQRYQENPL
jgi:hypothetical protein